ncbi:hypothetical protein INS49_004146 [Diaporthe citri]|uniref:uncharacterized protein n=1 Tax=Diaporthe citri TaxID=83186 RepID=UPI001C8235C7|nr:uncharacterized protein INS49_004146 [Diaporthe citri]KAG6355065.1 hypothetical protein INS49_004146 [Diaporthe citri]
MGPTTFTPFPELVPELRTMIWMQAIAAQVKDIADSLPPRAYSPWSSRRRQAFVGHDSSKPGRPRACLEVHIRDPYDGRKMRLEQDEFEAFVNCLPISAVCREARARAAEFCVALVPHILFKYYRGELGDVHCDPKAETLEHVLSEPTTLTVFGRMGEFNSPEQLVGIVSRFFGNKIERLILQLFTRADDEQELPYWADHVKSRVYVEPVFDIDIQGDPSIVHVTRDRRVHVAERTWKDMRGTTETLAKHLLEFYEILDVSSGALPHLRYVDLNLEEQGCGGGRLHIKSSYKDGVLSTRVKPNEEE